MAYVKYPTSKQLSKELEKNKLENIYIFLGEEDGEKEKIIEKMLDIIFKGNNDKKNHIGKFNIYNNDDLISAADFALSGSMFSSEKACIIKNIDNIKSADSSKLVFNDLISNLPLSTTLIMTSDKIKVPGFIKKNELKKIKIVQFWRLFDNEIINYVNTNLKKLNLEIDSNTLALLLEFTGKDIKKIDEAVELLRYSTTKKIITIDTIKNILHDVKDVSVFDCVDLIFKKDVRALKSIKKLLENGTHELLILNLILKEAETIEKFHSSIRSGASANEAVNECGVYSKNRDNFLNNTKLFSMDRIKKIFSLIAKADFEIKSTKKTKNLITNPVVFLVSEILMNN